MDSIPLVTDNIELGARLLDELRKSVPVQAAFWVREIDQREPRLFLALDRLTEEKYDRAYSEVDRILEPVTDNWFRVFRVKVIGSDQPLANAVLDLIRERGGKRPIRMYDLGLGGTDVAELYVYPSPLPAGAK